MKFPHEAVNRNIDTGESNKGGFTDNESIKKKLLEVDNFLEKLPENKFMLGAAISHFSGSLVQKLETSPTDLQFIKEKLKGETLIDLGCGEAGYTDGHLKELGVSLGSYIGVDKKEFEKYWVEVSKKQDGFPVEYVNDDLLRFVSKIPDNSANFLISGVDEDVLRDVEYRKRLMNEITRATKSGGIVLNYLGAKDLSPADSSSRFKNHETSVSGLSVYVKTS